MFIEVLINESKQDSLHNKSSQSDLEGKVALVTGAASGIGYAVTRLLAERGAFVVAEDINPSVEALASDNIATIVADISKDGTAEKAVGLAVEKFGKLDILVNNAGRILYKPIVELSREEWAWQMDTNVTGAFLHSREAQKVIMPNKSGAIINIASYASYFAFPGISAYTASKGALAQLTRTQALEAIPFGIRVNAIGVRELARRGALVILGARRTERLESLTRDIRNGGGPAHFRVLDVARLEDMQAFVDFALTTHGHIDVIVNNAGVMPLSLDERLMNWPRFCFFITGSSAAIPCSIGGHTVYPTSAVYSATKFAVIAISEGTTPGE